MAMARFLPKKAIEAFRFAGPDVTLEFCRYVTANSGIEVRICKEHYPRIAILDFDSATHTEWSMRPGNWLVHGPHGWAVMDEAEFQKVYSPAPIIALTGGAA